MKPNLKDFPKFPEFARLPDASIPPEVLDYCIKSHEWIKAFKKVVQERPEADEPELAASCDLHFDGYMNQPEYKKHYTCPLVRAIQGQ